MNRKLLFALTALALFATFAVAQPKPPPPPAKPDSPIVKKLLALPADDLAQLGAVDRALTRLGFYDLRGLAEFTERQQALRLLGEPALKAATVAEAAAIGRNYRPDDPQNADNLKKRIGSSFINVQRVVDAPGPDGDLPLGDGFWRSRFGPDSLTLFVEIRNLTDFAVNDFALQVILDPAGRRMKFNCNVSRPPPKLQSREAFRASCLHSLPGSGESLVALRAGVKGPLAYEPEVEGLSLTRNPVDVESRTDALLAGLTCADTGTCAEVRAQERRASLHGYVLWLPFAAAIVAGLLIMAIARFVPARFVHAAPRTWVAALAGMAIVLTADVAAWSAGGPAAGWISANLPPLLQQAIAAAFAVALMALVISAPAAVAYPLALLTGPLLVIVSGLAVKADGLALLAMTSVLGLPTSVPVAILAFFCRSALKSARSRPAAENVTA